MTTPNFNHIHKDFRDIAKLPPQDRIGFMDEPRWIGYQKAKLIMDTLQGLMRKPKRPRMPNLLITGDSNNGKTTIVRRFFDLCGEGYINEDNESIRPVVLAEAPTSADEKGLYVSILERFWAPYRVTHPVAKLRYQVIHQLRECDVKILIIDEFHSLLTGSALKQREVMNAIKLLCNELLIPIVGVGTREAVRVLHTDPQHASRFDVIRLPQWELDKDFQKLLAGFEAILPLHKPSKLYQPVLAKPLNLISEGNIGNLHRLLVECATEAILSGKEQIDLEIIDGKKWLRPTRGIRELVG